MRSRALLPAVAALVVLATLLRADAAPAVAPTPPLAAIEADVERARREFEIPGLAVAAYFGIAVYLVVPFREITRMLFRRP